MKGIFCYDGPLKKDLDGNFYGVALNDELFARYNILTSTLKVAISIQLESDEKKLSNLSPINNSIEIVELPNINTIKSLNPKYIKILRTKLENEIANTDLVIARLPSIIGNLAINIAFKLNKPTIVEMVGCPWDAYINHSWKGKFIAPIITYWTKKNIRKSKYVIYVTREYLQKKYPTNGKSVNCSNVVIKERNQEILNKRESKILNISRNKKIVIGTIGDLDVNYKGQKYVIEAISKLKLDHEMNIQYELVGGGNGKRLKEIAEKHKVLENVKFIGTLKHSKVLDWLEKVDIYVQPSLTEGLPRSVIEAMHYGIPCLGSNAGGIPELLDKKNIFKKKESNAIVNLLKNLTPEEMLVEMHKNSNEATNYTKAKIDKDRKQFYKEFLSENFNLSN